MVFSAEPIQTVLVSCKATVDILGKPTLKDNLITINWHMPCSFNPQMYVISVGKSRFSAELLKKSRCFAVNFMPFTAKEKVLFCGRNTGRHIDKFKKAGLTREESTAIDCPKVAEAVAQLECEVVDIVEAGDHLLFIGKILNEVEKGNAPRLFHTRDDDFTRVI
ncbi:MAG: flavin reductase family protein [Candidatus Woesearchaeota archaeon]